MSWGWNYEARLLKQQALTTCTGEEVTSGILFSPSTISEKEPRDHQTLGAIRPVIVLSSSSFRLQLHVDEFYF